MYIKKDEENKEANKKNESISHSCPTNTGNLFLFYFFSYVKYQDT
jgi:hypothetical protein